MYVKKMAGFVLSREEKCIYFSTANHSEYKMRHWIAQLDSKTCFTCRDHHGKIYSVNEIPDIEPPVHPNCRCEVQNMEAVFAGEATKDSENGADWWIKNMKKFPDYYISEKDLTSLGWRPGKAPSKFALG
ncbi:minor capsid protein [Caproicibacter fermentans]|uniref:minor capsid protein n=1 Tax=Caproicibacter fermentans TaxID=2576756 RepID=UPI001E28EA53|nr:minor capsid protein [Caproicibacter fermentans]